MLRAQLECVERQTGVKPEQLAIAPPLPELVAHLWFWYVDLANTERKSNGMGISRISSTDIKDWCWATGNRPSRWEIAVLKRLDAKFVESQPKPKKT